MKASTQFFCPFDLGTETNEDTCNEKQNSQEQESAISKSDALITMTSSEVAQIENKLKSKLKKHVNAPNGKGESSQITLPSMFPTGIKDSKSGRRSRAMVSPNQYSEAPAEKVRQLGHGSVSGDVYTKL